MSLGDLHLSGDVGWPLARLSGAIDLSNVEVIGARLEAAVSNRALGLVLDLSAVTYLDSTGLRLIYRLARRLGDRQQLLRLVVPDTSRILRVIELAGVHQVAQVVPDLSFAPPTTEDQP
jgi:anti-anti-sigma factor